MSEQTLFPLRLKLEFSIENESPSREQLAQIFGNLFEEANDIEQLTKRWRKKRLVLDVEDVKHFRKFDRSVATDEDESVWMNALPKSKEIKSLVPSPFGIPTWVSRDLTRSYLEMEIPVDEKTE